MNSWLGEIASASAWVSSTYLYLSIICTPVALCFVPLVLIRRKESTSTIAWILTLIFLPLIGVIMFWFLGRDRVRYPVRQKANKDRDLRGQMPHFVTPATEAHLEVLLEGKPVEQRGVMRLAARVGSMQMLAGNHVDVIVGAKEAYDAQIEAITQALKHIHLEYYIFRADEQGWRFVGALCDAARRGVEVRVLYDAFGSRSLKGKAANTLREAGVKMVAFFPLDPIRRAWTVNLRNHRKLMVVDGRTGFTGGINIGQEFLNWRDVMLRINGPAVGELQAVFLQDWAFATGGRLIHPRLFSDSISDGASVVQIVASGPDATVESIHRLYFAAIASARDRVYLTTPYFVPDRAILVALQTAALRGVDVRIIVPRHSNHQLTWHAGRSYYEELLEAGVQIHEYLPSMLHTKTMVVDGRFATVGSANLDVRSFRLNFELIAVLYDADVVGRLERLFLEDLGSTELVDLDAWRTRAFSNRLAEGVGRLCAPML